MVAVWSKARQQRLQENDAVEYKQRFPHLARRWEWQRELNAAGDERCGWSAAHDVKYVQLPLVLEARAGHGGDRQAGMEMTRIHW